MKSLKNKILFILLTFSHFALADLIYKYCDEVNGTVYKKYKCPKSKITLPLNTCEFTNDQGIKQFFNGCSGPSGGHNDIFYPACIQHDLCYHHEPISSGKTQHDCDFQFYKQLIQACKDQSHQLVRCKKWAKIMYRGVRIIGKPAFHCADYPNGLLLKKE